MLYNRYALSRFSFEQYPMVSYFQANGWVADGIPSNFWSFGDGTHIGFRATPSLTVSTEFTSSVFGGPFSMGSTDFGVRVKPWTDLRVTPFVDARLSWAYTTGRGNNGANAVPVAFLIRSTYGDYTTGSGHGAVLALGADTRVNENIWLTTALSHSRYGMTNRSQNSPTGSWDYKTNVTRLAVGVRYNHGRWMDAPR
jgi:hypothetical protein